MFSARNALVVTDTSGKPITTLTGPNGSDLVRLTGTSDRFQFGGGRGIIENNQLKLIANRIGPGGYADHRGTYIASFSLPSMAFQGARRASPPAPSVTGIYWADLFQSGGYTYIYGDGYAARVPIGNLAADVGVPHRLRLVEQRARRGQDHQDDGHSQRHRVPGSFDAFGKELQPEAEGTPELGIFSTNIRACLASTPYGPFPDRQCSSIYRTPEAGQRPSPNEILIPYAVSPHFDDINGNGMLLSYSVHPLCFVDCPSPGRSGPTLTPTAHAGSASYQRTRSRTRGTCVTTVDAPMGWRGASGLRKASPEE